MRAKPNLRERKQDERSACSYFSMSYCTRAKPMNRWRKLIQKHERRLTFQYMEIVYSFFHWTISMKGKYHWFYYLIKFGGNDRRIASLSGDTAVIVSLWLHITRAFTQFCNKTRLFYLYCIYSSEWMRRRWRSGFSVCVKGIKLYVDVVLNE